MFNILDKLRSLFANATQIETQPKENLGILSDIPRGNILTKIDEYEISPMGNSLLADTENPAVTRLILDVADAESDRFKNLSADCQITLDEVVPVAIGFMAWAADMVREGRRIASIPTEQGSRIVAIDPRDGTYIEVKMPAFAQAGSNVLSQPGMPSPT